METFRSFEDLECWREATKVRRNIKEILKQFPPHEKFGLTDNMRRASRSITQNIAEGYGRFHYQENIQFCRISRGSLFELIDQYITAQDEGYISVLEYKTGREQIDTALRILNGYINYLEKQKKLKGK